MNSTCCAARNVYCNISCVCVRQGVKWAYSWYGNMVVKFRKKMFRAGGREPKKTKEEKKKEKEALKLEALGGGKRKREEDHEEDEVTVVEGPKKKREKKQEKNANGNVVGNDGVVVRNGKRWQRRCSKQAKSLCRGKKRTS